ncbi:MAG: hypothetical protein NTY19_29015 [Planctomycetota bacterium]|nr:hypothetical protein [Planctomycetota bacterium]
MIRNHPILTAGLLAVLASTVPAVAQQGKPKFCSAPQADLSKPIIWGAQYKVSDELGLAFGGCEQAADDGAAHTRVLRAGTWVDIRDELHKANAMQVLHDPLRSVCEQVKDATAAARSIYFGGAAPDDQRKAVAADVAPALEEAARGVAHATAALEAKQVPGRAPLDAAEQAGRQQALARLVVADKALTNATAALSSAVSPDAFKLLWNAQVALEQAAESLDAEPAPRALSPLAYDAKTKRFVLFGGDHLDYVTNDTWVFDPAKQRWEQRHPQTAPPPRANHTLTATGDGTVRLSGGFTHNNTDIWYMGPLYQLRDDGDWVYDVAANTWTSLAGQEGVAADQREYRTMSCFLPQGFIEAGGRPDAAANEAKLKALPTNTWVVVNPPLRPRVNRDWGSACIAPDRDVLLRWSGGHCAHGGSDVPMYHFATNRWELSFPVEFCLGQCYSNTSYPTGLNFNRRPWVSGHTYKSFEYDPVAKRMVFVGHNPWSYLFDPGVADWSGRTGKPRGMSYDSSFYTLTCSQTPAGIYCWTAGGDIFVFNAKTRAWQPVKLTGERLPGSAVDHCGLGYDSQRDRLICFPTAYGRPFTGQAYAIDRRSGAVQRLAPSGIAGAKAIPSFLRELAYLPGAGLLVDVGSTLPADSGGVRPMPAYDCAANKWVALTIAGPAPAGKDGRNVSAGAAYDAKRGLIWATDTDGQIYVLRLDASSVVRKDL